MKSLPLSNSSSVALVDDEDYQRALEAGTWFLSVDRARKTAKHCVVRNVRKGLQQKLHHFILGNNELTDHRDHNPLNNQKNNLRPATNQQNQANRRKTKGCTSQYKGVSWQKAKMRWRAYICPNERMIHLGYFFDEKQAARAYDEAAKQFFGEFALTNF